jgi:hypothetical protein
VLAGWIAGFGEERAERCGVSRLHGSFMIAGRTTPSPPLGFRLNLWNQRIARWGLLQNIDSREFVRKVSGMNNLEKWERTNKSRSPS